MRPFPNPLIEPYRKTKGPFGTRLGDPGGVCEIPGPCGKTLLVIFSAGQLGWDHVSVSVANRCPNWPEMCKVKELFFEPEECVMQLHPPASDYLNNHPYCLHLWRPLDAEIPMPPSIMVGIKNLGELAR